jgi:hypothetical protein
MKILKYLANLPYNDEHKIWLNIDLNPHGRWLLSCKDAGVSVSIEVGHNSFVVWLESKGLKHDNQCTSYSFEI